MGQTLSQELAPYWVDIGVTHVIVDVGGQIMCPFARIGVTV